MRRTALTPREAEILVHVRAAEANKDIAEALGISEQAVKALVSRLLMKFDVANRAGLISAHADERNARLRRTEDDLATARRERDVSVRDLQLVLTSLQQGGTAIVGPGGEVILRSAAYEQLFPNGTVIADVSGRPLPPEGTPWARAQRGESFEQEVTVGGRRIHVHGDGAVGGGGVIRAEPD